MYTYLSHFLVIDAQYLTPTISRRRGILWLTFPVPHQLSQRQNDTVEGREQRRAARVAAARKQSWNGAPGERDAPFLILPPVTGSFQPSLVSQQHTWLLNSEWMNPPMSTAAL